MSLPSNHPLALSATETELLRDFRSRLNRMPADEKPRAVLAAAFFKVAGRVGVEGPEAPPAARDAATLLKTIAGASLPQLAALTGGLAWLKREDAPAWRALFGAGVAQAVLSRRLALAGREPAIEDA